MRVGLNISLATNRRAGIGNYAFELARHLPIVAPNHEWVFFGPEPSFVPLLSRSNARVIPRGWSGPARILWEQTGLPLAASKEDLDLLHGTDIGGPIAYRRARVHTIHDLSPFADPQFFPLVTRAYKQALTKSVLQRSAAIITISDASRAQILERFAIDEDRVITIHLGVEQTRCEARRKADPPFLLHVGTLRNRKNLVALVKAFRILCDRRGASHRLVFAGKTGYGWRSIQSAIRESGVSELIEMRGYVSQEELSNLYRSASLLVDPSVYDYFSLPVLEALACGMPVACSRAASPPELSGDAVVYFDPFSVEDLAATMERVLESPTLQAQLREKGLRQVAKFTWEECARRHMDVYRMAVSQ